MFGWSRPKAVAGRESATLFAMLCSLSIPIAGMAGDAIRDNLYGVSFTSSDVGWASGAFGTIVHTMDGGKTWKAQPSGATEPLFSIDFVNDRVGWAVGRTGTIVHTGDAGVTWEAQKSPSEKHLFSVDFLDESFGIAVGDWGIIVVTEDGGKTWQDRSLTEDVILNAVTVVDRSTIYVAGEIGALFRSDDAGRTWARLQNGVDKTLFGIGCADAQRCWAVGIDAVILRTQDGGATWDVRNGSTEMRALEQVGFGQAFDNPSLYAIAVRGNYGLAVGELGSVFESTDGGASWNRLEASKNWALPWFRDLALLNGRDGAIVGARGRRVMIRDGRMGLDVEGD